jgi:hypothetical protein
MVQTDIAKIIMAVLHGYFGCEWCVDSFSNLKDEAGCV